MRFTTKTEYGLVCLSLLANQYPQRKVIALKDIVKEEHYPLPYIEKIFQTLRSAKIVDSHPGKQGGYALARPPSEITLKEIIEALEGATFDVFCEKPVRENIVCTHLCICGMKPVWRKTKQLLDGYYDSITLEMVAKHQTLLPSATAA